MKQFLEGHYGDFVALLLVLAGGALVVVSSEPGSRDLGNRLSGAGLMALKLTHPLPGKGDTKDGA